jgi:hypothetical protein
MMATEDLWGEILSQQEERVFAAFELLNPEEKNSVVDHLRRMVSEKGWHPAQVESASYALRKIEQNRS